MSNRQRQALAPARRCPAPHRPKQGSGGPAALRAGALPGDWIWCYGRLPSAPAQNQMNSARKLSRRDGAAIAYHRLAGASPGVVFLGGLRSDMTGTKALFLEDYCRRRGQAYLRFDYFGHGASTGDFDLGTIGRWA